MAVKAGKRRQASDNIGYHSDVLKLVFQALGTGHYLQVSLCVQGLETVLPGHSGSIQTFE
jgi:hypothetical protein